MDNSHLIYIIIQITLLFFMIIISYYVFLNYYDDTVKNYMKNISTKLVNVVGLFDENIMKKIDNEINYINNKLGDVINSKNNEINKKNHNLLKSTANFPFLLILLLLCLIISLLFIGLYNKYFKLLCENKISFTDISINIAIVSIISLIILSIIQYFFLIYFSNEIIEPNINTIIISILNKLKEKSNDIYIE